MTLKKEIKDISTKSLIMSSVEMYPEETIAMIMKGSDTKNNKQTIKIDKDNKFSRSLRDKKSKENKESIRIDPDQEIRKIERKTKKILKTGKETGIYNKRESIRKDHRILIHNKKPKDKGQNLPQFHKK